MIIYKTHIEDKIPIPQKYHLLLDDIRFPQDCKHANIPDHDWVIVRDYLEFVDCITKYGMYESCSYDHDLEESAYKEYMMATNENRKLNYNNIAGRTGLDCAQFAVEYCLTNNIKIPEYFVHSMNEMGKENIICKMRIAQGLACIHLDVDKLIVV